MLQLEQQMTLIDVQQILIDLSDELISVTQIHKPLRKINLFNVHDKSINIFFVKIKQLQR